MSTPIQKHAVGDDAVALLPTQHRVPNLEALVRALVAPSIQEIEDVLWSLLTDRWLSNATGAQLDGIGEIVGLKRTSTDDEEYRSRLYLQVAINTSQGDAERLIDVCKRVSGAAHVHFMQKQPAVALLYAHALTSFELLGELQRCADGGVRVVATGSESQTPFVFGFDRDADGDPHGEELPYGEGFAEYVSS